MVEQPQTLENNVAKEREDSQKNRVKATFSFLDHAMKIYNDTETYIKRGLTLFGLGTVIAGASFGAGQHLQSSPDTPTSDITPQQPVNHTPQPNTSQPQIIYVTPPPSQSGSVPHPEPAVSSPPVEQQPAPAVTPPVEQQPTPVVSSPPAEQQPAPAVHSSLISEELSQVKQAVNSVTDIEQDLSPFFGDDDDDDD